MMFMRLIIPGTELEGVMRALHWAQVQPSGAFTSKNSQRATKYIFLASGKEIFLHKICFQCSQESGLEMELLKLHLFPSLL